MGWNSADFILRETLLHLKRERLIAVTTISTVAVLMLVLGSLVLLMLDVRTLTRSLRDIVEVRAYFSRGYPRDKAEESAKEVARWSEVKTARFIPKEEGWRWLSTNLVSSKKLKGVDNPLPDAISAYVRQPEMISQVAARLERLKGVKDVVPSASESKQKGGFWYRFVQGKQILTGAGIALCALVVLAAIFIVHNTIRLALHNHWREIYIMQLIGASASVIAAPFLLEGMVHGAIGAVLAGCVVVPVHMYLRSLSAEAAPFIVLAPDKALASFAAGLVLAGIALGLTGSAFSVRRYLRRKPEWHT
ncbi:MAG: cell division protein FtsX [Armatimonadota bacterium]